MSDADNEWMDGCFFSLLVNTKHIRLDKQKICFFPSYSMHYPVSQGF